MASEGASWLHCGQQRWFCDNRCYRRSLRPSEGDRAGVADSPRTVVARGYGADVVAARGRGWRVWLGFATLLVTMLVAVDLWLANREMDRLLVAVERSEDAMLDAQGGIRRAVRESGFETMDPAATSTYEYEQARMAALSAAESAAAEGSVEVRTARVEIDDVSVLPWHRDIRRAQEAYLNHSDAWVDYLRVVSANAARLGDGPLTSDVSATFRIAESRFTDAVPWWDLRGAEERIDPLFAQ